MVLGKKSRSKGSQERGRLDLGTCKFREHVQMAAFVFHKLFELFDPQKLSFCKEKVHSIRKLIAIKQPFIVSQYFGKGCRNHV